MTYWSLVQYKEHKSTMKIRTNLIQALHTTSHERSRPLTTSYDKLPDESTLNSCTITLRLSQISFQLSPCIPRHSLYLLWLSCFFSLLSQPPFREYSHLLFVWSRDLQDLLHTVHRHMAFHAANALVSTVTALVPHLTVMALDPLKTAIPTAHLALIDAGVSLYVITMCLATQHLYIQRP